jgi:hypothetical protein
MLDMKVAVIDKPQLRFAVMEVSHEVLSDQPSIDQLTAEGVVKFGCPVVLTSPDYSRSHGRAELVQILKYLPHARLPWARMRLEEGQLLAA